MKRETTSKAKTLLLGYLLLMGSLLQAQDETIPLWESKIPNSISNPNYFEKTAYQEGYLNKYHHVTTPTLSVFTPKEKKANGTAVLIMPGGGYRHLSFHKEGVKIAQWLNSLGITAFVLKYRLPNDSIMENKSIAPLQDAQEALRYIRANSKKWHCHPDKIGVLGSSAGGHLAATLSTQYHQKVYTSQYSESAQPNFTILLYPVISMDQTITHKGSRTNLLGNSPSEEAIQRYSNEMQVDKNTAPTFLVHATDDLVVPVENSIRYYHALLNHKIKTELHVFESGGHGFGLGTKPGVSTWPLLCQNWLLALQLLPN